MYNETMYERGNAPSAIRELFAYGMKRKAQIGEDKVFDFSIGNPSVPGSRFGRRDYSRIGRYGACSTARLFRGARPRINARGDR